MMLEKSWFSGLFYRRYAYDIDLSMAALKKRLSDSFGGDAFLKISTKTINNNTIKFNIQKIHLRVSLSAHLKGVAVDNGQSTNIHVEIRPNYLFIINQIICLIVIVATLFLFFVNRLTFSNAFNQIAVFLFFSVFNYFIAIGLTNNLKDNFEASIRV